MQTRTTTKEAAGQSRTGGNNGPSVNSGISNERLLGLTDDAAGCYLDQRTLSRFVKKIQDEKVQEREDKATKDSDAPSDKKKWYRRELPL